MKRERLTYEEHRQFAERILCLLQDLDSLCCMAMHHGDERHAVKNSYCTCTPLTIRLLLDIGKSANALQCHMEQSLALADGNDGRSWDLYFPQDRPGARVNYRC